jgi:hypothetical protein
LDPRLRGDDVGEGSDDVGEGSDDVGEGSDDKKACVPFGIAGFLF